MLYSKKSALLAVFVTASLVRAANECVDTWSASRCSNQKRKGNCVPEAQCPNPKKDGIKCTRARSQCMATCRLCDDDSASSCTSPPPPTPPPGADYPCDTAYELRTLTQAYDWCATNCDGRTVKVIKDTGADVDYSDESGGVCAIGDHTGDDVDHWEVDVTLTEHDDCFVLVVKESEAEYKGFGYVGYDSSESAKLLGLGGNDVLCGSSARDFYFYGGDGDDLLAGGPNVDENMHGDAGADKIFGGEGNENFYTFSGGEGEDSLYADPGDDAIARGGADDCADTDGGAEDVDGYTCGDYSAADCGAYDDSDFSSNDMCCRCGGGSYE